MFNNATFFFLFSLNIKSFNSTRFDNFFVAKFDVRYLSFTKLLTGYDVLYSTEFIYIIYECSFMSFLLFFAAP